MCVADGKRSLVKNDACRTVMLINVRLEGLHLLQGELVVQFTVI